MGPLVLMMLSICCRPPFISDVAHSVSGFFVSVNGEWRVVNRSLLNFQAQTPRFGYNPKHQVIVIGDATCQIIMSKVCT